MGEVVLKLLEIGTASLDSAVEIAEVVAVSGFLDEGGDDASEVIFSIGVLSLENGL